MVRIRTIPLEDNDRDIEQGPSEVFTDGSFIKTVFCKFEQKETKHRFDPNTLHSICRSCLEWSE